MNVNELVETEQQRSSLARHALAKLQTELVVELVFDTLKLLVQLADDIDVGSGVCSQSTNRG